MSRGLSEVSDGESEIADGWRVDGQRSLSVGDEVREPIRCWLGMMTYSPSDLALWELVPWDLLVQDLAGTVTSQHGKCR